MATDDSTSSINSSVSMKHDGTFSTTALWDRSPQARIVIIYDQMEENKSRRKTARKEEGKRKRSISLKLNEINVSLLIKHNKDGRDHVNNASQQEERDP